MLPPCNSSGRNRTLESLIQLVAALDRRVAHPERAAEQQIALDASHLRDEANRRIADLQRSGGSVEDR